MNDPSPRGHQVVERERRVISDALRLGGKWFQIVLRIVFCLLCHSDATMELSELGSSVAIEEIRTHSFPLIMS